MDPVTREVLRNGFEALCEETKASLVRTGHSPNIRDRRDCSTALFDATGELVAMSESIPVHLGSMPFSVEAVMAEFELDELYEGDSVALNDPFKGGSHLPDVTLVTPVFLDGEVAAVAANRAHHSDVGGSTPGGMSGGSTELFQEGLVIPPVKLLERGEWSEGTLDIVLSNVRTPGERLGDLRAQRAANETCARRLGEMAEGHGTGKLKEAFDEVKDYSERRMRAAIREVPDGCYSFEDRLDGDGRGNSDVAIAAEVTVSGGELEVDFSGSAEQTEGPVNSVFAVTASATYFAVLSVTDPEIPPNKGCYRPVEIVAPSGTVVNAEHPAPVVGGNLETSQRIVDVLLGAFAEPLPDRVVAGCQGTMNNLAFGGRDREGESYVFYETHGGGFGASPGKDGMDGVHSHMSNTLNTPVEVLETEYPFRVLLYGLREGSGGHGEFRGGLGLRRELRLEGGSATFSLLADRRKNPPYGLSGGGPGSVGEDRLVRDGDPEPLDSKTTVPLEEGDVVSIGTPGGGGYGDPELRDPEAVRRDVEAGKLPRQKAEDIYGWKA